MRRRTVLLWSGALTASAATVFGTGAFSSTRAIREVAVSVTGDGAALLALSSGSGDPGGFVTEGADGTVSIDIGAVDNGTTAPAGGANDGSVTAIDDLLRVENRGQDAVELSASFPPGGGVVLFRSYGGPLNVVSLADPGGSIPLNPGASTEVGVALDAGYGTPEIPGTFADGDVVEVTLVAATP